MIQRGCYLIFVIEKRKKSRFLVWKEPIFGVGTTIVNEQKDVKTANENYSCMGKS